MESRCAKKANHMPKCGTSRYQDKSRDTTEKVMEGRGPCGIILLQDRVGWIPNSNKQPVNSLNDSFGNYATPLQGARCFWVAKCRVLGPSWFQARESWNQGEGPSGQVGGRLGQVGTTLGQVRPRSLNLVAKCSQVGLKLGPSWGQVGASLGPSCSQVGPSWGQVDYKLGKLGTKIFQDLKMKPNGIEFKGLGPSWLQVCMSWRHFGSKLQGLAQLGSKLEVLKPSWLKVRGS
eukprot:12412239-Karenia_brevis.AAC.1